MTEFFVIMQKRSDGKVYADLANCLNQVYLTHEKAQEAFDKEAEPVLQSFYKHFHIVRLIAYTEDEHALAVEQDLQKYYAPPAALPIEK
jgi:hypothetical protein